MNFNQKFEPKVGIFYGAGQSIEMFTEYWKTIGDNKPIIYMAYVKLPLVNDEWFNKTKKRLS